MEEEQRLFYKQFLHKLGNLISCEMPVWNWGSVLEGVLFFIAKEMPGTPLLSSRVNHWITSVYQLKAAFSQDSYGSPRWLMPDASLLQVDFPQEVPGYVSWKHWASALLESQVWGILGWAGLCLQDLLKSWLRSGTHWHHGSERPAWPLGLYNTYFQCWCPWQWKAIACWTY